MVGRDAWRDILAYMLRLKAPCGVRLSVSSHGLWLWLHRKLIPGAVHLSRFTYENLLCVARLLSRGIVEAGLMRCDSVEGHISTHRRVTAHRPFLMPQ